MTEIICIVCPKGCRLKAIGDGENHITGNSCNRGLIYGREELTNPKRTVSSTVRIDAAKCRRCPVKTGEAIPKKFVDEALGLLETVRLSSPVKRGQVVVEDICGTGIPFIVTRDL